MSIAKPDTPLTFRVVLPHEIAQVKQEVSVVFFSGGGATIDTHFEGHTDGTSTTFLGYEAGRLVGIRHNSLVAPLSAVLSTADTAHSKYRNPL